MREIKFRAWHSIDETMIYPRKGQNWGYGELNSADILSRYENIMQYTGLKDSKGKEIWEGDIVDCLIEYEGKGLPHRGEIVYDETHCSFATKNEAGVTLFCKHQINTREVIGNIYEGVI